ncbi:hypothetical protein HGRIS_006084 [Hohenbuehelia grisea]|uniref:Ras-GEF domain-containing protein n=1 Tax=Hohenbuehelia grisea TaxID=104357 RepID=A0ABR3K1D0_9AGAR
MSLWVAGSVCNCPDRARRTSVVEFWIDLATELVSIRNFSGAFAVYIGVCKPSVNRMKQTLAHVDSSRKRRYLTLETMFDGFKNLAGYRSALGDAELPAIPLMSTFIHDLAATNALPTQLPLTAKGEDKTLINFGALRNISKTLQSMKACHMQYQYTPKPTLQDWLDQQIKPFQLSSKDEERLVNEFYDASKRHERRMTRLVNCNVWQHTLSVIVDDYAPALVAHDEFV